MGCAHCALILHFSLLLARGGRIERKEWKTTLDSIRNGSRLPSDILAQALYCIISSLLCCFLSLPSFPMFPPHVCVANLLTHSLVRASGYFPRCPPTPAMMAGSIQHGGMCNLEAARESVLCASANMFVF